MAGAVIQEAIPAQEAIQEADHTIAQRREAEERREVQAIRDRIQEAIQRTTRAAAAAQMKENINNNNEFMQC